MSFSKDQTHSETYRIFEEGPEIEFEYKNTKVENNFRGENLFKAETLSVELEESALSEHGKKHCSEPTTKSTKNYSIYFERKKCHGDEVFLTPFPLRSRLEECLTPIAFQLVEKHLENFPPNIKRSLDK